MNPELAPIVLFTYNRPDHTLHCLQSLQQNELADKSTLYIYADGQKQNASEWDVENIKRTREVIRRAAWCKEVIVVERLTNKGLAGSIIEGVTEIVNQYGKVIVLEDDIITSKGFLTFMNNALQKYENEDKVLQVSGFNFPLKEFQENNDSFFIPLVSSWGWATWKHAWEKFDPLAKGYERLKTDKILRHRFDLGSSYPYSEMLIAQMEEKTIDSWAIRWLWSQFTHNKLTLFPSKSYVSNIGYGDDATHTRSKPGSADGQEFTRDFFVSSYPETITCDKKKWSLLKKFISSNYAENKKYRDVKQKFASLYYDLLLNFNYRSV